MAEIQLEQPQVPDIYSLGFDKNLNRSITQERNPFVYNAIEDQVAPQLLQLSGITIGSGGSLFQSTNFKSGKKGWQLDNTGNAELGGLFFNRQFVSSFFESFSGWTSSITGSASASAKLGGAALQTGTTINSKVVVDAEIFGTQNSVSFALKNPTFEAYVATGSTLSDQTLYFGVGDIAIADGTETGFGFKIVGGTLSALSSNAGTETLTTITGITLGNMNRYQAFLNSTTSHITYYVNGVSVAIHSTNIPVSDNVVLLSFSISNSAASNKIFLLRSASFAQDT